MKTVEQKPFIIHDTGCSKRGTKMPEYCLNVKPAELSEEDEENFKWFDKFFRAESIMVGGRDIPQDKYLWFKSLRPQPKQEWSEEEKKKIANIMMVLMVSPIEYAEEIEFLKSLRPQPHWKPSEEQSGWRGKDKQETI